MAIEEIFMTYGAVAEFAAGTGAVTNLLGPLQDFSPAALALDSAGNLYAAALNTNCIYELPPGATVPTVIAGICGGYQVSTAGFSGDNGLATAAQLNGPAAIAVDTAGNLYIADRVNNRVRKVTAGSGIITTIAGNGAAGFAGDNGPAVNAELNDPMAVAVDSAGNLYIGDYQNHRVRKIAASTGVITTIAGTGPPGYTGDGGAGQRSRTVLAR